MSSNSKKIVCPVCETLQDSGIPECTVCKWELNSLILFETDEAYRIRLATYKIRWEKDNDIRRTPRGGYEFIEEKRQEIGFCSYDPPGSDITDAFRRNSALAAPFVGIDLGNSNSKIAGLVASEQRVQQHVFDLPTLGRKENPKLLESCMPLGRKASEQTRVALKQLLRNRERTFHAGGRKVRLKDALLLVVEALLKSTQNYGFNVPAGVFFAIPSYFRFPEHEVLLEEVRMALKSVYNEYPANNQENKFVRMTSSSMAAVLNYVYQYKNNPRDENVLAIDFGAGGFETAVFKLSRSSTSLSVNMLSVESSWRLSGRVIDEMLFDFIRSDNSSRSEPNELDLLALEQIKMRLTCKPIADISGFSKGFTPRFSSLDRKGFASMLRGNSFSKRNIEKEFRAQIKRCIQKSPLGREDISVVLSSGGCSQIPFFQDILHDYFPQHRTPLSGKPQHIYNQLFYASAQGAALYGAHLLNKESAGQNNLLGTAKRISINPCTAHALGYKVGNSPVTEVISANSPVPEGSYFTSTVSSTFELSSASSDSEKVTIVQGAPGDYAVVRTIPLPIVERQPTKVEIFVRFDVMFDSMNVSISIPGRGPNNKEIRLKETIKLHLV